MAAQDQGIGLCYLGLISVAVTTSGEITLGPHDLKTAHGTQPDSRNKLNSVPYNYIHTHIYTFLEIRTTLKFYWYRNFKCFRGLLTTVQTSSLQYYQHTQNPRHQYDISQLCYEHLPTICHIARSKRDCEWTGETNMTPGRTYMSYLPFLNSPTMSRSTRYLRYDQ
jgi:hypothetical protein